MDYGALAAVADFSGASTGIQAAAAAMLIPIIAIVGWRYFKRVFSS